MSITNDNRPDTERRSLGRPDDDTGEPVLPQIDAPLEARPMPHPAAPDHGGTEEPAARPASQGVRDHPGEMARQGRIVLTSPARRAVFIGGLLGVIVIALLLAAAA